jgi:hypothetical protein
MVKILFFIVGVIITVGVIMVIFYGTFLSDIPEDKSWAIWLVLAGSILLGGLVGFLLVKFEKVGAFALGGWGGYCLALLIYNSFLYMVTDNPTG